MIKDFNSNKARQRRHTRVRRRLAGTSVRPRLSIYRSGKHIYAQIVDDSIGKTIVAASSLEPELRANGGVKDLIQPPAEGDTETEAVLGISGIEANHKVALARAIGRAVAERAKAQGITQIVFDRSGYPYHGRVAAVAIGAREGGLDF